MLIALMADIHGNREAFEACLAHARRVKAERFVFLGDYVGYGADPGWVVETVREQVRAGAVALQGNHDAAVLGFDDDMNADARAAIRWTRGRIDADARAFLSGLPLTIRDGDILYVHANAWAPGAWGYVLGPVEAERSLCRTEARVTICGHVHAPALYAMAPGRPACGHTPVPGVAVPLLATRRWLAVMGAVGQPRDGNPAAAYGLLDDARHALTIVRVAYDVEAAARKIIAAGLPPRQAARLFLGR
jgi:diadenosine tetraphosphatase ApaH/serine/threonine PP2A family protein phosphatase